MALHILKPERRTLHGVFSRELPPVLTVAPGDTVRFTTLDARWSLGPRPADGGGEWPKFEARDPVHDAGHCLTGPVYIEGAQPGMTLAVEIGELRPGSYGWTIAGGWDCEGNRRLGVADGPETWLDWTIDADTLTATERGGRTLPLCPFLGVMGVAPEEPGLHPTPPPRSVGGNLDCKELVSGVTLYLPVKVPGALFSCGDGHALQGDGEVCVTAIECPFERADLTFHLRDDFPIATPHARTPDSWITLGVHEDLDEAMYRALDAMLDLMEREHGLPRREALALASLVVDLRVTQIVNGVKGVHAVLKDGALG